MMELPTKDEIFKMEDAVKLRYLLDDCEIAMSKVESQFKLSAEFDWDTDEWAYRALGFHSILNYTIKQINRRLEQLDGDVTTENIPLFNQRAKIEELGLKIKELNDIIQQNKIAIKERLSHERAQSYDRAFAEYARDYLEPDVFRFICQKSMESMKPSLDSIVQLKDKFAVVK